MKLEFGSGMLQVDWLKGKLCALRCGGRELLSDKQRPVFSMRLRDAQGVMLLLRADEAQQVEETAQGAAYRFAQGVTVYVSLQMRGAQIIWSAKWETPDVWTAEYLDFPMITLGGKLRANGGDGAVLWSYNEGGMVEDGRLKPRLDEPEYPSHGSYSMFPYMLCAQFTSYLFEGGGLYMGVHDALRGPKGLDFACNEEGVVFRTRLFLGGVQETPEVVWQLFEGDWMDAAEIYRDWFENHLPSALRSVVENPALPEWYRDMPIVVTYPVRGIHDMDIMDPNKFFPYGNALPFIDEIAEKTGSRILVLLMHWEGTAPWAPPIVWPPYGGEEMLKAFMNELHARNHLLGVYCSGLGWTEQSNLIASYNTQERFERENLREAMCLAPDGSLPHSCICTGQRSGYDICPASEKGKELLEEALDPLFAGGLDYIQAMDQNHGGSMYFCYSPNHGHPRVPGAWMTRVMEETMTGWKKDCPNTLLGCESAAAEPYLEWLSLSDNRYELNYRYGRAVPLYSWLYHPYLHNFMGNQVCAPFAYETAGICYRLAYSFAAGDMLTLVLNDEGEIMFHWGMRDFSKHSDKEQILTLCKNIHRAQDERRDCLSDGRMIRPEAYSCAQHVIRLTEGPLELTENRVLSSAWETPAGERWQFFVNYTDAPVAVTMGEKHFDVPALDVVWRRTGEA